MSRAPGRRTAGPQERLERVRAALRQARRAEPVMKHGASPPARDAATAEYARALDAIYAELVALDEIGALDELQRVGAIIWREVVG